MSAGFRRVREEVVQEGHAISWVNGTFLAPDGEEFTREIIRHPGAVAVVPVLDDRRSALLVRQYRSSVDELVLEIPAGKLDVDGEAADAAAARELAEEVGRRAGRMERLGSFLNSPGFTDERGTVYLGLDLQEVPSDAQGVEERHMTLEEVALADIDVMVADGHLVDAKSIIGLLLARDWLTLHPE